MSTVDEGLTIEVMDHQGIVLLALSGDLTGVEAPAFLEAIDAALERRPRNLQLGMLSVTFMDSGGVQGLVNARERVLAAGVPMQLLGVSKHVDRVLRVTHLRGVFDIIE